MVFGVLNNFTDGFIVLYVAIFLVCVVFNRTVMKKGYWLLSGGFSLLQLVVLIWIAAEGDDSSMLIMFFVLMISLIKANNDRVTES
jgi:thiol:disulfide interchange protein